MASVLRHNSAFRWRPCCRLRLGSCQSPCPGTLTALQATPCLRSTFCHKLSLALQAALAAELNEAGLLATPENPQPRHPELAELAKLPYLNAVSCTGGPPGRRAEHAESQAALIEPVACRSSRRVCGCTLLLRWGATGMPAMPPTAHATACLKDLPGPACTPWHHLRLRLAPSSLRSLLLVSCMAAAPPPPSALPHARFFSTNKTLSACRVLDRDTTIRGYRLPKGTPILFCPITLHYSPENWTRADEFLPERFLDGQGKHEMSDARELQAWPSPHLPASASPCWCGQSCQGVWLTVQVVPMPLSSECPGVLPSCRLPMPWATS